MAWGVVVSKGPEYLGSLIAARLDRGFGREVFGVPGHLTQPSTFGPDQRIKQGAK
jgi:DNA processing protein